MVNNIGVQDLSILEQIGLETSKKEIIEDENNINIKNNNNSNTNSHIDLDVFYFHFCSFQNTKFTFTLIVIYTLMLIILKNISFLTNHNIEVSSIVASDIFINVAIPSSFCGLMQIFFILLTEEYGFLPFIFSIIFTMISPFICFFYINIFKNYAFHEEIKDRFKDPVKNYYFKNYINIICTCLLICNPFLIRILNLNLPINKALQCLNCTFFSLGINIFLLSFIVYIIRVILHYGTKERKMRQFFAEILIISSIATSLFILLCFNLLDFPIIPLISIILFLIISVVILQILYNKNFSLYFLFLTNLKDSLSIRFKKGLISCCFLLYLLLFPYEIRFFLWANQHIKNIKINLKNI